MKKFITKVSDKKQVFVTGAERDTQSGKGRFDLIPPSPMLRVAQLYERGGIARGDRNWEKGMPLMRFVDSIERHTNQLKAGEPREDHGAAIVWNTLGYMWTLAEIEAGRLPRELDNRPPAAPQYAKRKAKRK
jgi:hypothetical protein